MINSEVRCAMVTINPFPIGNVATIRYSSYMRAIAQVGCFAKVYIFAPSRTAKHNTELYGIHNGIHYVYTSGKITLNCRNAFTMLFYLIVGLVNCCRLIRKDRINTLILYGENPWPINLFFKIVCSLNRIKYYGDRSEYPLHKYICSRYRRWIYRMKIRWFDGMILMTEELVNYYSNLLKNRQQAFLLPMTIDCHRFDNVVKPKIDYNYIAVVFGVHNRDGLLESIKSYNRYRELGGNYHLLLVGNYDGMPNKVVLDEEIISSEYKECIHICGLLPNDQLPGILAGASCLMTTPNSYPSGGFPTKLGEYMLSGVPIVATVAGSLLKYVEADTEVKFSNPMDIESIATNLLYVENNKQESHEMAIRAMVKAKKVFNAETYIQGLLDFFSAN